MVSLPPDLARLGDELTAAAARELASRRRRRRRIRHALACAVAGIASIAVLAPAGLGPASRTGARFASVSAADSLDGVVARPPERRPVVAARAAVRDTRRADPQPLLPRQRPWRMLS